MSEGGDEVSQDLFLKGRGRPRGACCWPRFEIRLVGRLSGLALDAGKQLALPDALQVQVTVVILTVKQNREKPGG